MLRTIALVGLAALVVVAGPVAAAPASTNTTTDHPNATATDDGGQGPPLGLPDAVPQQVRELHRTIQQFLDGTLNGSLGDALQGLLGQQHGAANARATTQSS